MEMAGIRSSTTDSSSSSSSSSIDSTSTRPPPYNHHHFYQQQQPFNNNNNNNNTDLSTDLRLGLSLISSSANIINASAVGSGNANFFIKVYMEGIPIGRKLDLFAHHGYHELVTTLTRMFRTSILYPGIDRIHSDQDHVLTYEDKEGDLMMVGDVPWDLFLSTVKRLKITRSDNC